MHVRPDLRPVPALDSWAPGPISTHEELDPTAAERLGALLDVPGPVVGTAGTLPPLWHWLYFLEWPAQEELGGDGHATEGHFLPPVPDRRRMVAGGRVEHRDRSRSACRPPG